MQRAKSKGQRAKSEEQGAGSRKKQRAKSKSAKHVGATGRSPAFAMSEGRRVKSRGLGTGSCRGRPLCLPSEGKEQQAKKTEREAGSPGRTDRMEVADL